MSPGNSTPLPNARAPRSYQFIELEDVRTLLTSVARPLLKRIERLEAGLGEWVDTKEALQLIGLSSGDTLKCERERHNTRILFKMEVKTSTTPVTCALR